MQQIQFQLEFRSRYHWGSLQQSPDLLVGFKGPTSKAEDRKGKNGRGGDPQGFVHTLTYSKSWKIPGSNES